MRYNTEYTFENSFKIKNSLGGDEELKEKSIVVQGETSSYYLCRIENDTIPTMLSKKPIDETFKIQNEYYTLMDSGMFWELFPDYIGTWSEDREEFTKFYNQREANRINQI